MPNPMPLRGMCRAGGKAGVCRNVRPVRSLEARRSVSASPPDLLLFITRKRKGSASLRLHLMEDGADSRLFQGYGFFIGFTCEKPLETRNSRILFSWHHPHTLKSVKKLPIRGDSPSQISRRNDFRGSPMKLGIQRKFQDQKYP